ncbi:hypothetical protein [Companilactobacillus nantensis]|uniref:Uncharacterized protein n=1 Tax=Companilactobacillus nantensis DSM 16982 TaxID=1423774 RepID=A0A0R1WID3_9LACO|nr:hypothetical protein [Companilactobacillus nantensis]KRM17503.1 hypothetical protein FD31_GL002696 [Companilactobacillus nantensis DSM 16982]GEO64478.1 hypothetical protein LNA01_16610 [Companilactobacillus nantensis]
MKIAVQLNSDRNIIDTYLSPEDGAKLQVQKYSNQGWLLVDSDSTFSTENEYQWTVRESDNKLVHINTNQTPEEERDTVISNLTLQNLQQANEITELKKFSSSQTLQSLQNAQDKENLQKVATSQAMQILELQKSVSDIKSEATTN